MAFVYGKISEEDRALFRSFNLVDPFTGEPLYVRNWSVDRERNAYFIALGGQGSYTSEIPTFYALVWKDKNVKMSTFSIGKGSLSTGIEMFWKVTDITAPESFRDYSDEMLSMIKEAIESIGFGGNRDVVTRVNFDLIEDPWFVQEVGE